MSINDRLSDVERRLRVVEKRLPTPPAEPAEHRDTVDPLLAAWWETFGSGKVRAASVLAWSESDPDAGPWRSWLAARGIRTPTMLSRTLHRRGLRSSTGVSVCYHHVKGQAWWYLPRAPGEAEQVVGSLVLTAQGPKGSGKTTLLRKIQAALGEEYVFEFHAADPDRVTVRRK